jgi:hypothetical protein
VANDNDPHLRRAGDPSDHEAERDALRHELGMGAVRSPLPLDIDRLVHEGAPPLPDPAASAEALMDMIARHAPPASTHFVDGALDEHARHEQARHEHEAHPEDSRQT